VEECNLPKMKSKDPGCQAPPTTLDEGETLLEARHPPAGPEDAGGAPSQASEGWRLIVAFAAYGLLAAFYLRPIWRVFGSHIAPDIGDPLFNLYLVKWVAHEAHRAFAGFWDPPFFYPARGVLAYSDHLLGPGLVAEAFTSLVPTGLPRWIPALNFLLWSSFAGTGVTACFVLRRGGLGWAGSWLGGVMYAFSPFRWDQLSHLQVLLMQLIPVTLWSFDRLLASPSRRRAALFLGCYLLHLSGSCYLAYMIHVPLAVLLANRFPGLRRDWRWRTQLPLLGGTALIAAVAAGALFGKYWEVGRDAGLHWGPSAMRAWGASVLSYLTPSHSNLYSGLLPESLHRPENSLFPGWLAGGLALLGAHDLWRQYRRPFPIADGALTAGRRLALGAALAVAAAGWLLAEARTWSLPTAQPPHLTQLPHWATRNYSVPLALVALGAVGWLALRRRRLVGRSLRWREIEPWPRGLLAAGAVTAALSFPIVFDPVARLLPSFASIRVPARFDAFTSFVIVWLAATALDRRIVRRTATAAPAPEISGEGVDVQPVPATKPGAPPGRLRGVALAALVTALLLVEVCPRPVTWVELLDEADFPEVYSWIAQQPDIHALLELPLTDPSLSNPYLVDIRYMYYGTLHWRPLVNGYSAHLPFALQWLRQHCCSPVAEGEVLAQLRRWGVSHILVHVRKLPLRQRPELDRWAASGNGELLYAGGGDRVYRLLPEASSSR
jgi:hypothetical protein